MTVHGTTVRRSDIAAEPPWAAADHGGRPAKKVLMIAAAFPPTGGPGVQRSAKFAKYLPQFGWAPTVWTVDRLPGLPEDPTLLADLPECVGVHRVPVPGGAKRIQRHIENLGRTCGVAGRIAAAAEWRLRRIEARTALPDDLAGWARASHRPACEFVHRHAVDLIYSTFSPASNHLLGLELKRRTGLSWIADFRDLWTDDYRYRESPRRRRAHRRLEQDILEEADAVIGVTPRQVEILAGHVPGQCHKFVTITNGFDPEDFTGIDVGERNHDRFVLAHVGRLDRWRSSEAWFEGLRRFINRLGDDAARFRIAVVGHANEKTRSRLFSTGATCSFSGYVEHGEAVRAMVAADALLLNVPDGPNSESVIPGKLFEYLASRRPILVVGPPGGECERIVTDCAAGLTVNFSADAVADALFKLFDVWRSGQPMQGCPNAHLGPYSRRVLTGRLAALFDALASLNKTECRRQAKMRAACPRTVGPFDGTI